MYDYCELNDWNEPDFDPPTPADYGWVHEDNIPDLDNVKTSLKGILNSVYFTGDVDNLENCLDEICGQFELKLPTVEPVICYKTKSFSSDLFNLGIVLSAAQANQGGLL